MTSFGVDQWTGSLERMFLAVRAFLLTGGRTARNDVGTNPKGQVSFAFDAAAEELVAKFCEAHIPIPLRLLSEERGEILVRAHGGSPWFTLIVDPVDGSENFRRSIEVTCFSAAVLPDDAPPAPANVVAGLVGNVLTGTFQTATRGQGAFSDRVRLRTSGVTRLSQAMLALECEFVRPGFFHRVEGLMKGPQGVRFLGSSVAAQMGVASGAFDAYVDVRGTLTPENFMAGALIIGEAGGIVTDERGLPLPAFNELHQGFMLVASATHALHREVLATIGMERSRLQA